MRSAISEKQPRASVCSQALRSARPRVRQHLNNAVVTQRVVQQLEENIQAAEAPGFAHFPEGRQIANVAFSAQFRPDGEPAVRLLEREAIINPPVGDQLLELRDRDRVFRHPRHNASAVDRDRRALIDLALPEPVHAAVRFLLYMQPSPHGSSLHLAGASGAAAQLAAGLRSAARPDAANIAPARRCPTVPVLSPDYIAHVSVQYKLLPFDKRPLFVLAAHSPRLISNGQRL